MTVCGANHIYEQYLSDMQTLFDTRQARSQGGANGCNCTPPLDARSTWQAINIIHLIVYCSAIYTYLDDNCQLSACMHVRALVRSKCRIEKMATGHRACIIFGANSSLSSTPSQ